MADLHEAIACELYAEVLENQGDVDNAIEYYKYAALHNRPTAAFALGNIYNNMKDYSQAYYFYKLAADTGLEQVANAIKKINYEVILKHKIDEEKAKLAELYRELGEFYDLDVEKKDRCFLEYQRLMKEYN